jgi:hypothetical protein
MDDLIRYAYAAIAVLLIGIAFCAGLILYAAVLIISVILSGNAGLLQDVELAVSVLLAAYCMTGLILVRLGII